MEGIIISYVDENLARGHGIVKVQDGSPNTPSLDDAAFTPGMRFIDRAREVTVNILSLAETAQIQVQRGSPTFKPEATNTTENPAPSPTTLQTKTSNTGVIASNSAEVEIRLEGSPIARKGLEPCESYTKLRENQPSSSQLTF